MYRRRLVEVKYNSPPMHTMLKAVSELGGVVQGVEPESAWAPEEEEDWSHEPSVHGGRRVLLFRFPRFFGRVATVAQATYGTCALQLRSNCRG